MGKKGFYYNQQDCIGCKACQIACKDKNRLPIGTLFRHVDDYEVGDYPDAKLYPIALTCNHCMAPECVSACPSGAMYIDEEDGTVQHDDSMCIGCLYCTTACPYGNPKYLESLLVVRKCDACYQLRQHGEKPACVQACQMRALDFGEYEELFSAHQDARSKLAPMPEPITQPCTLIDFRPAALEVGYRRVHL